jgi:hypothetical protein
VRFCAVVAVSRTNPCLWQINRTRLVPIRRSGMRMRHSYGSTCDSIGISDTETSRASEGRDINRS